MRPSPVEGGAAGRVMQDAPPPGHEIDAPQTGDSARVGAGCAATGACPCEARCRCPMWGGRRCAGAGFEEPRHSCNGEAAPGGPAPPALEAGSARGSREGAADAISLRRGAAGGLPVEGGAAAAAAGMGGAAPRPSHEGGPRCRGGWRRPRERRSRPQMRRCQPP
jgi:hypothetical protein